MRCYVTHAPFCRRHHKVKQARGWHVTQPEPGTLIWTAPHGRSYTVQPGKYPVSRGPREPWLVSHLTLELVNRVQQYVGGGASGPGRSRLGERADQRSGELDRGHTWMREFGRRTGVK